MNRKPTRSKLTASSQKRQTKTSTPSRLSAPTSKRTHGAHYAAVVAIKDALHAARYRCTGEANGTLEAYVGGGRVPVILVQTYQDDAGVEVWQPCYAGISTKDTIAALTLATTPEPEQQRADAIVSLGGDPTACATCFNSGFDSCQCVKVEETAPAPGQYDARLAEVCAQESKTWTPPNEYRKASANLLTESIRAASALRGILADAVKSAKYPSESATSTQSLDAGRKALSLLLASISVFQTAQRADMEQTACQHGAYPGPCYLCDPLTAADARMVAEDDRKTPPAMGEDDMERDRR